MNRDRDGRLAVFRTAQLRRLIEPGAQALSENRSAGVDGDSHIATATGATGAGMSNGRRGRSIRCHVGTTLFGRTNSKT